MSKWKLDDNLYHSRGPRTQTNYIGARFGALVVKYAAGHDRYGRLEVACICDCGNECIKRLDKLKAGSIASCGCKAKNRTDLEKRVDKLFVTVFPSATKRRANN